jgi:hypothetical protein
MAVAGRVIIYKLKWDGSIGGGVAEMDFDFLHFPFPRLKLAKSLMVPSKNVKTE